MPEFSLHFSWDTLNMVDSTWSFAWDGAHSCLDESRLGSERARYLGIGLSEAQPILEFHTPGFTLLVIDCEAREIMTNVLGSVCLSVSVRPLTDSRLILFCILGRVCLVLAHPGQHAKFDWACTWIWTVAVRASPLQPIQISYERSLAKWTGLFDLTIGQVYGAHQGINWASGNQSHGVHVHGRPDESRLGSYRACYLGRSRSTFFHFTTLWYPSSF